MPGPGFKKGVVQSPEHLFKPGQSGNPKGRAPKPKELTNRCLKAVDRVVIDAWIDELELRDRGAVQRETYIDDDGKERWRMQSVLTRGKDWVKASELLASYGLGKPPQPLVGADGGDIQLTNRVVVYLPDNGRGDGQKLLEEPAQGSNGSQTLDGPQNGEHS